MRGQKKKWGRIYLVLIFMLSCDWLWCTQFGQTPNYEWEKDKECPWLVESLVKACISWQWLLEVVSQIKWLGGPLCWKWHGTIDTRKLKIIFVVCSRPGNNFDFVKLVWIAKPIARFFSFILNLSSSIWDYKPKYLYLVFILVCVLDSWLNPHDKICRILKII